MMKAKSTAAAIIIEINNIVRAVLSGTVLSGHSVVSGRL